MADIDELERRARAALDRIAAAIEQTGAGGGVSEDELRLLRGELEEERLANAQLKERIKALRDKQEAAEAEQATAFDSQRQAMAALDAELQKLRKTNDLLRESNEALRSANAEGVGEPHLINKAMLAELESIRAARAADAAEAQALLATLEPLLAEAEAAQTQTGGTA